MAESPFTKSFGRADSPPLPRETDSVLGKPHYLGEYQGNPSFLFLLQAKRGHQSVLLWWPYRLSLCGEFGRRTSPLQSFPQGTPPAASADRAVRNGRLFRSRFFRGGDS